MKNSNKKGIIIGGIVLVALIAIFGVVFFFNKPSTSTGAKRIESEYGIMVEYVNEERASFTEDGAYWALYVNGEYGQYGADAQPVTDGDTYAWVYELAQ